MLYLGDSNKRLRRLGGGKKYIYAAKTYKNPFFRQKRISGGRPASILSNKIKLITLAAFTAAGIIIWLIFFSLLFKIQNIEVSGVNQLTAAEIETTARRLAEERLIGKNNLLLYNKSELINHLNENYYFENLSVSRKLFHTFAINLTEKRPAVIWKEEEDYYYLDGWGKVITRVDPLNISGGDYPLIENYTGVKITERQANISDETAGYILKLFNEYKDKRHDFTLDRFIVDNEANTVKLSVLGGPRIYFNVKKSVEEQTAKLDRALSKNENLKKGFTAKKYIDLRFADNVYSK